MAPALRGRGHRRNQNDPTLVEAQWTQDVESTRGAVPERRVLHKLSGETFGGGDVGLAADVVQRVAAEIAVAVRARRPGRHRGSAAGTSSAGPSSPSVAWTGLAPTTWACSARS